MKHGYNRAEIDGSVNMENKTLTDTEMFIFACFYMSKIKSLESNASMTLGEKVLYSFVDAVENATLIRQNADFIKMKLSKFQSNTIELEVLRKILGQEPE